MNSLSFTFLKWLVHAGRRIGLFVYGTLLICKYLYKNLVYKNVKASKCPKIKNVVVILLVAISFEGFEKK